MDKTSFDYVWELLAPSGQYESRKDACRALWNALTLQRQRLIYATLREQKRRGESIDENPYFAINNCHPVPTNWNGKPGVNDLIKSGEKMVIAKYCASYGTYTLREAQLFGMTDLRPLN